MAKSEKIYTSKYGDFALTDKVGVRETGDKIAGKVVFKIYIEKDEMAQYKKIFKFSNCFEFGKALNDFHKIETTDWREDKKEVVEIVAKPDTTNSERQLTISELREMLKHNKDLKTLPEVAKHIFSHCKEYNLNEKVLQSDKDYCKVLVENIKTALIPEVSKNALFDMV